MQIPVNLELERRLLSTLMFGAGEVQAAVADGLVAEAYSAAKHARIFAALCCCAADNGPTDSAAVWRIVSGLHGEPIELAEVFELDGLEPTSMRRRTLTADVIALWRQRRLIAALAAANEEAQRNAPSWDDVWERTSPHLTRAAETANGLSARSVEAMRAGARNLVTKPAVGAFNGPFRSWDIDAKPLRAGQLVVLAGRPGTGKTAMALHYLDATISNGLDAAIFSLEMEGEELLHRMAHQKARSAEAPKLVEALARIPVDRLHIFESRDHSSLAQIESRCRLLAAGKRLGIVIVDYLQLVRPPKLSHQENREQQVAAISRSFKLLAGQLGCPLMVLAQLNRESEKDQRRPRLSDLRESGAIEQDADVVWLLWEKPPEGAQISDSPRAEVHLIQAKRRNGQPNIFARLSFERPILSFFPIHPGEQ